MSELSKLWLLLFLLFLLLWQEIIGKRRHCGSRISRHDVEGGARTTCD